MKDRGFRSRNGRICLPSFTERGINRREASSALAWVFTSCVNMRNYWDVRSGFVRVNRAAPCSLLPLKLGSHPGRSPPISGRVTSRTEAVQSLQAARPADQARLLERGFFLRKMKTEKPVFRFAKKT